MNKTITQEIIASEIGICLSWANLIINGRRHASFSVAKKFAHYTDTNPLIWMESGHEAERQLAILKTKLSARSMAA